MIKYAIIEDDNEIREYLKEGIDSDSEFTCLFTADSVEYFLRFSEKKAPPEILLLDINLPGMSGINALPLLKEKFPEMEIVMLTNYDDSERIFESLKAGASGYLLKSTSLKEIKEAINQVIKGGAPMSPQIGRKILSYFRPKKTSNKISPLSLREKEVVQGLVDGLSYKQIAERLNISPGTIYSHIKNIYKKLRVNSKSEVIAKSFRGEL
jgi:DNA-binding NarL/FixJ family response regulator